MGVLVAGELAPDGLVLLLQLRVGFIGLLEKLKMAARSFNSRLCANMQGCISMRARAGLTWL